MVVLERRAALGLPLGLLARKRRRRPVGWKSPQLVTSVVVIDTVTGQPTGLFQYNGLGALGNPPIAYSAAPGTTKDPFGNTLPVTGGGFITEASAGQLVSQLSAGGLSVYDLFTGTHTNAAGSLLLAQSAAGVSEQPIMTLKSPGTAGGTQVGTIALAGRSNDTTVPAQVVVNTGGSPVGVTTALLEVQGHAAVLPGDGNTYDTERLTLRLASPVSIGTIATTVFSKHLGTGTYEIEIWAVMNNATAADPATMSFAASGGLAAAGLMDFEAVTGGVSPIYGASATFTASFAGQAVTANQRIRINTTLVVTIPGTLVWQGITPASTVNVNTNSRMRICPIVAT